MQQPLPLNPTSNKDEHASHSHSHSNSLPQLPKQHTSSKSNLSSSSVAALSAPPPVPPHPLRQTSLSPSSRNNRVSPSPLPPVVPPPLPSKPPTRSRPSSQTRPSKLEGELDEPTAPSPLQAAGDTVATHATPLSTARTSTSKKLKIESPPPSHPSFVNGGMTLSHFQSDEDDEGDCTIITTTVVATEREVETRPHVLGGGGGLMVGQGWEEADEREPGAPESEESGSRGVNGLRLGLRLGGFEEAKEESEIPTIPVFQDEQKEGERRKPKLTLAHLSSHNSASPIHQLPRLPLTLPTSSTSTSRPHTPQKPPLRLHAEEAATADEAGDSILITTTTTTTTTTTSTQMRLLPLAAATTPPGHGGGLGALSFPSSSSSSAPFVPSKQSNMATTQSTSSRAAKLDFFLHDCTLITPTLYIGGQIVASDRALLHQHGITHVVNACGAVCDNYFPDDFSYYRLYLQDKGSEDVLCILYEVFHFIAAARAAGGKTLIHCQQGVSRSTVLGIGYLMMADGEREDSEWTYADYQTAYSRVRSKRGISSPNLGFVCQLLAWSRRLLGRFAFSSSLYRFAPHNSSDRKLVNKWY